MHTGSSQHASVNSALDLLISLPRLPLFHFNFCLKHQITSAQGKTASEPSGCLYTSQSLGVTLCFILVCQRWNGVSWLGATERCECLGMTGVWCWVCVLWDVTITGTEATQRIQTVCRADLLPLWFFCDRQYGSVSWSHSCITCDFIHHGKKKIRSDIRCYMVNMQIANRTRADFPSPRP